MGPWQKLFTLSYDNRVRGYDVVTGALEHEWENENRCHFTWMEVWGGGGRMEVRGGNICI